MIQELVTYLDLFFKPLGFKTLGLSEQVMVNGFKVPAVYSKGSYDPVNIEPNTIYHRIVSGPMIEREAGPTVKHDLQTRTYRMRLFASFDNNLYCLDSTGGVDQVLGNLIQILENRNIKELREAYKLQFAKTEPRETYRDKAAWDLEIGVDYIGKQKYLAVDYEVRFKGLSNCFEIIGCGGDPIDIVALVRAEICEGETPCPPCPECEDAEITVNSDLPPLSVASGGSVNLTNVNSAGTQIGTRSGTVITNADMTIDYPDATTAALVLVPGSTITVKPHFTVIIPSGATSFNFTSPALDATFVVDTQTLTGGGSISNIVINGGAPVASFNGQSIAPSVVITGDITGTVDQIVITFV